MLSGDIIAPCVQPRVLLLVLIAVMAITPAFAAGVDQNRLERTVLPEHFNALPFSPWPLEPVPPFRATPIRPERVVYRLKGSIREVAKVDRDLSTACRRGTFIQRLDFIFRVRSADDRPYGIGWGSGVNLHDPEKRSQRRQGLSVRPAGYRAVRGLGGSTGGSATLFSSDSAARPALITR